MDSTEQDAEDVREKEKREKEGLWVVSERYGSQAFI